MFRIALAALALAATAATAASAQPKIDPKVHDQALDMMKRSIGFRTVKGAGQTVAYAEYLKGVLVAGGYRPDEITIEPMAGTAFLIARYPGADPTRKPLVVNAHMDVVEARREDWERDPFTAVVENGWIYGRGAQDNKFDVSLMVTTLAKLRREGWKPGRDVILALSGDEETDMATTAVLAERLKGAEMVLNIDGGGGELNKGKPVAFGVQGAEKTYADFSLTVTDPGGHSSRPTSSNAIYRLSRALGRIEAFRFPTMWNDITLAEAAAAAKGTAGPTGEALKRFAANPRDEQAVATLTADPNYNPGLRTTCVATMIEGGHAPNALPQRAEAKVNCRIFPGTPSEKVRQTLTEVIADPSIAVKRLSDGSVDSPPSPLRPDVMAAVTHAVHARFPGLPIVPSQAAGATDSMWFRAAGVPSYGVGAMFTEPGTSFAHGLNEKAPVSEIGPGLAYYDMLLKALAK